MGARFEGIVGAENVESGSGRVFDAVPVLARVRPGDEEEVGRCVAAARDAGVPVLPTGAGTKWMQANRPAADALVLLDLSRLVDPIDVQADEGIVTVAAGATVTAVEEAARAAGKRTRLSLLYPGASVGGTIAADPVDPEFGLERRLRDDLLGLNVVLANGEISHSGGQVVKNVTGFDLVRLFCGSMGTLGVITRATLRLWPLPEARVVVERRHASLEAAIETSRALQVRRADPAGVVIRPQGDAAQLLWLLEGPQADVDERVGRVEGGVRVGNPVWWEARGAMLAASGADGEGARIRVSGRPSDALAIARAFESWAGPAGIALVLPADGVVFGDVDEDRLDACSEHAGREGWTLKVERASPEARSRVDVFGPEPDSLGLMRAVKTRFDPEGVLCPGRFIGGI